MRLRHKPLIVLLVATTATCGIAVTALSATAGSRSDRTHHRPYKPKPHWPTATVPRTPGPSTPGPSTPSTTAPATPTPRPSTLAPTTAPPSTPRPSTPAPSTPAPSTLAPTQPTGPVAGNPVAMTHGLYVDPNSEPRHWVSSHSTDARAASIRSGIADVPLGRWYNGGSSDASDARAYVSAASAAGQLPVLVAYNLGGTDAGAYRAWIDSLVAAVGDRPAIVILEPDALPSMGSADQARLGLLAYAVDRFAAAAPNTWTYLDAGHDDWTPAATMAERLRAAHVSNARGFSLNVSNYQSTARNVSYATAIGSSLGSDAHFVIDVSRNGIPLNGDDWCNPAGERLGERPRADGTGGLDLRLWVKPPGESDGDCGIGRGTYAGQFSPLLAMRLLGQ